MVTLGARGGSRGQQPAAWRATLAIATVACMASWAAPAPATQVAQESNDRDPGSIPAWRAAQRVVVISVHGEIDEVTRASVLRRLESAAASGADMAVLELDTPGGDLKSTLDICAAIRASSIRTIAWVHPQAFSAGAIIALATDAIVVSPAGVFGDAAPIAALPGVGLQPLPETERAKIEAPVVSEVVESARRVGRDERLVERFVRLGDPFWLVERPSDGMRMIVDRQELGALRLAEDNAGTGRLEGDAPQPWFQPFGRKSLRASPRERVVAGTGELGWVVVARVAEEGTLLTVREREAVALGLAEGSVANDVELSRWTGGATISRLDERWSESLVRWLTGWPVRLVLVAALLICFIGELLTPGVGAFGAAATCCLVILVGSPALIGMSEWWATTLVLVGLGLVAMELLLVPGSTWVGLAGALCFCLGMVGVFTGGDLGTPEGRAQLPGAAAVVLGGIALAAVGIWGLRRAVWSSSFMMAGVLTAMADEQVDAGIAHTVHSRPLTVGESGVAETALRPSGQARFGQRLADVVALGAMVDAGTPVKIIRIDGITTEVEPIHA